MVRKLWVAKALRGSGLGAALMGRCETEAVHRGCARVCVDTMSFQAPAFYRRLGYREKGVIRDVYGGHDRIFFEKHLRGAA
jgi:ribosomal protein S18 acetylase RimI-like enzyme